MRLEPVSMVVAGRVREILRGPRPPRWPGRPGSAETGGRPDGTRGPARARAPAGARRPNGRAAGHARAARPRGPRRLRTTGEHAGNAPSEPSAFPVFTACCCPTPGRKSPQHVAALSHREEQGLALGIVRAADQRDVALAGRDARRARCAPRRRRPASSPMKVREEPVTPCTMEMLPASRLESCARNSVGRRSLISRSLR